MAELKFADISNWNPEYDPAKDPNVQGVIVKTSGNSKGEAFVNPLRTQQLAAARAAGKVTGHYHFATPDAGSALNQEGQVDLFLANADIKPGDIIQWDWEGEVGKGLGPCSVEEVLRAGKRLEAKLPKNQITLYTNTGMWATLSPADKEAIAAVFKSRPFNWFARYKPDAPIGSWVLWQYTDGTQNKDETDLFNIDYNRVAFKTIEEYKTWSLLKEPIVEEPPVAIAKPTTFKCNTSEWTRQSLATQLKLLDIERYLTSIGFDLKQVYGYVSGTNSHVDGRTWDIMIEGPKGDLLRKFLWDLRDKWDLHYVVFEDRIYSTTPGKGGAEGLVYQADKPKAQRDKSHFWHVHVTFRSDRYTSPFGVQPPVVTPPAPPAPPKPSIVLGFKGAVKVIGFNLGMPSHVKLVQTALKEVGFDPGPVDGKKGKRTNGALVAFLRKWGFEPTSGLVNFRQLDRLVWEAEKKKPGTQYPPRAEK